MLEDYKSKEVPTHLSWIFTAHPVQPALRLTIELGVLHLATSRSATIVGKYAADILPRPTIPHSSPYQMDSAQMALLLYVDGNSTSQESLL